MISEVSDFLRNQLKVLLPLYSESQIHLFKLMYSHKNLDLSINDIIDNIPDEKLEWAFSQVKRSKRSSDES